MNWLYTNVNHLTVPLGILLGLLAAIIAYYSQRYRRSGIRNPLDTRPVKAGMALLVLVGAVLIGVAMAHNHG